MICVNNAGFLNSTAKRDRAWPQSIQRRPHDTACKHVATSNVVARFQNNQRAKPAYSSHRSRVSGEHAGSPWITTFAQHASDEGRRSDWTEWLDHWSKVRGSVTNFSTRGKLFQEKVGDGLYRWAKNACPCDETRKTFVQNSQNSNDPSRFVIKTFNCIFLNESNVCTRAVLCNVK